MVYSPKLKEVMLRRLLPPNNESVTKISKEEGIPQGTLSRWKNEAKSNGIAAPTGDDANTWSTQDKFLIVVETASMNANGGVAQQSVQLSRELKESEKERKKLEKELLRKDKALAETAALLVLSKKAHAIWGDKEDEQ